MPRPSQTRVTREKVERSAIHFQKTKLCKFHVLGVCTRGDQCSWAHDQDELKALPDFFRTKLCHTYLSKGVCKNVECRYAHGYNELRSPDEADRTLNVQWQANDVQFAFMQVIPFAPAMPVVGAAVPQSMNFVDGMTSRKNASGYVNKDSGNALKLPVTSGSWSRQTTVECEGGDNVIFLTSSEDGDLWVESSDQGSESMPESPLRSTSSAQADGDSGPEDDDDKSYPLVRIRNTFLEFGSAQAEEDEFSTADASHLLQKRRRAKSLGARPVSLV
mmetsp:Transcript_84584/g.217947  ORF Transcript_84584/g.217947 Transcript_84584/m.217947 type:complete len:275 (+) Transcript_84584:75-899(+)|eukprot:CAMPEP_0195068746 /NCGR_PEP_ID=MMETSP0448-20130528/13325_1 /TAXON_ID=66468 /ORGANISM="Heterocapsa triquestra, Strain CCMP 448" /LENGTH=274 /DNA_ID=CAMNT_0040100287 /DNA_START=74 /DNA_END=898 /DNA_ORIENTATION=-